MKDMTTKKYNYNSGIKTEQDRLTVSFATMDVYAALDNADHLLQDLLTNNFENSGEKIREDSLERTCFLENYEIITAKLNVIWEKVREAFTILDIINGRPDERSKFYINQFK